MNRTAIVGIFTIIGLAALFAFALVLANVGTAGRYKIGVHFKSASGLHKGALVYESGVVVGTVERSELLPDYSVLVTLGINRGVQVPRASRVLIEIPLTGDSTVEIVPPVPATAQAPTLATAAPEAVPTIRPDDLSDPSNIAQGTNPATVEELLAQGQGEIARLDTMLAELEKSEPRLIATLQSTLDNANALTRQSSSELASLSAQLSAIATQFQGTLTDASGHVIDLTANLDDAFKRDTPRVDALLVSLQTTARSLNQTVDTVRSLAADPNVHQNLVETTRGLAATTTGIAEIVADVHRVSGNAQTQNQLRDTVANLDASAEKLNSLLGSFGGTSSVYGVDRNATPAPNPAPSGAVPGGTLPPGRGGPGGTDPNNPPKTLKRDFGALAHNLAALQLRVSYLTKPQGPHTGSPTLPRDQGPVTDVNAVLLPKGATSLVTGVSDLGGFSTTANAYAQGTLANGARLGGGIMYSRLGVLGGYTSPSGLGVEARAYDLRRPTFDAYLNLQPRPGIQLFGGERDVTRDTRRTVFGLQLQY